MASGAAVPHVHFLIPCYGGQISEATFTSFVRFTVQARDWGIDWTLDTLVNESLIPRGRNALVARAMANPLATHLMFVDSDILFEPADVLALLQENVDVIGGGYPKKSLPVDYVINPCPGGFQDDGKVEVLRLGTGFLLIRREVFVKLAEASPHLKYTDDCGLDPSLNPYLYAYFDCGLVPGHDVYMSEDWMFCNRWRDLGGKVFLSKRFALGHVGTFLFSETAQQRVLSRIAQVHSPVPPVSPAPPVNVAEVVEELAQPTIKAVTKASKPTKPSERKPRERKSRLTARKTA
jgi:hypothetical protein